MWLKGCPKCRGDLFEEPSIGLSAVSRYISCLQCGHVLTNEEEKSLGSAGKAKGARIRVA